MMKMISKTITIKSEHMAAIEATENQEAVEEEIISTTDKTMKVMTNKGSTEREEATKITKITDIKPNTKIMKKKGTIEEITMILTASLTVVVVAEKTAEVTDKEGKVDTSPRLPTSQSRGTKGAIDKKNTNKGATRKPLMTMISQNTTKTKMVVLLIPKKTTTKRTAELPKTPTCQSRPASLPSTLKKCRKKINQKRRKAKITDLLAWKSTEAILIKLQIHLM
mgnify:FL=1